MHIRPARPKDFDAWLTLWKGYQDYYEADLSATTDDTWARLMEPPIDGPFALVAEAEDGALVGLTHYVFHAHTWRAEPSCYLIDLFTDPLVRGKGVGRALIEAVYARADARGAGQVYWLTQDFNAAGRRLYDKVAKVTPFIKYQR
jgi:GNAT superfamily N-acetyltransferase